MSTRLSIEFFRNDHSYRVQLLVRSSEHFEEKKQQLTDMLLKLSLENQKPSSELAFFDALGAAVRNRFDRTVRVRVLEPSTGRAGEQHFVSKADAGMKRP